MDFDARLKITNDFYRNLEARRGRVKDEGGAIQDILARVKEDLDKLGSQERKIDFRERDIQLLKCEKNLQKALRMIASRVAAVGPENQKKQERILELSEREHGALKSERKRLKAEGRAGVPIDLQYEGVFSRGIDPRASHYRDAIQKAKAEKRDQVALLRGLDVVNPNHPSLDRARSRFQEGFKGNAADFYLPVDPYSTRTVLTPAKFDMIRQMRTNQEGFDFENFSPEHAVGNFIGWAQEHPNEAQYFLADVAPLAIVTGRTKDYLEVIEFVKKNAVSTQFAPSPPGQNLPIYDTVEAFRLINDGVRAGAPGCVAWFEEWGLEGPLREFDTAKNPEFVRELKKIHGAIRPIHEKQIKEAKKGTLGSAKEVYEKLVEQGKGQEFKKGFSPAKLGYDVQHWPWGTWFSSIFKPKSAAEGVLRLGLAAGCAVGAVATVGGSVALIALGASTFGISPVVGWVLLPVGMSATAAIYGYGNDLIDRFVHEKQEEKETGLSPKGRYLVRRRLSNSLYKGWIKSGFIHHFPKAKKGSYPEKQFQENFAAMQKEFEARLAARYPEVATPYEVAKDYREVVEEFAFRTKIRGKTPLEQKAFEMAVNQLVEKSLKPKLKEAIANLEKPELFDG